MNKVPTYQNIRFDRRIPRPFLKRALIVCLAIIISTVLWRSLPIGTQYWMWMPLVAILTWVASYGWRQALSSLIVFLRRLEQL